MKRRTFLAAAGAAAAASSWRATAQQNSLPAHDVAALVRDITGGREPERSGILVELPPLVDNGNAVPLHVRIDSPMTAKDHVTALHVIAERNPNPVVAVFRFTPQSARAEISTRMRLAATQTVTVVAASSDGRFRLAESRVYVTSGACLDESPI